MTVLSTLSNLSLRYKAASAGAGLAGLVLVMYYVLKPRPLPGIPYNKSAARRLVGDLPDLEALVEATTEGAQSVFFDLTTRRLGVPIAQVLLPGIWRPIVVVDDPREVEDILLRRGREFDRSPLTADAFAVALPKGSLSQLTTPSLKAQKRLWADCMHAEFLRVVVAPNIVSAAEDMVELWRMKEGEVFHVLDDLTNMALDAIYVAIVGEKPMATREMIERLKGHETERSKAHIIKETMEYLKETIFNNSTSLFPKLDMILAWTRPAFWRITHMSREDMRRVMRLALERFSRLEASQLEGIGHDTCAMDMVLRRLVLSARKEGKPMPDPTNEIAMLDELSLMLSAGHDSTANTMAFFVKFMELYPAVQSRLRADLRAAFPGPQLPSSHEILEASVPYLDAVVEETIRCAGTINCTTRLSLVDTEVLGCPIPKGTEVILNTRLNRAPFLIDDDTRSESSRAAMEKKTGNGIEGPAGRDFDVFDPERWLVKDESGSEVFDATALPTLVFGGGYRGCAGRKLAMLEMRLIFAVITLSFEFLEIPEQLRSMRVTEKIFRQPNMAYAKLRAL